MLKILIFLLLINPALQSPQRFCNQAHCLNCSQNLSQKYMGLKLIEGFGKSPMWSRSNANK